ncbi:hypothetical protein [Methylobacterium radiodurans]|uniref:Uncharacterized protein n=1 Tax=Methylobacterium radiodurans TaxID=2202828 RepID=A0A2U8VLJ0_9HYPH|nr:hypothetical protein [Methylobacterium radiodurans]AWN34484.1 hypothetical protein DK427_00935 [Methylobacterium radiodurans]
MDHRRSTFAVTGIAVLGLLAAAGILHPGNFAAEPRSASESHAVAAGPTAWVDPPARSRVTPRSASRLSDTAALMKPEPTAVLSADGTTVQPLPAQQTQVATTARTARLASGPRLARRVAPTHQTALVDPASETPGGAQRASRPKAADDKTDPIGDLIRSLGLGDQG